MRRLKWLWMWYCEVARSQRIASAPVASGKTYHERNLPLSAVKNGVATHAGQRRRAQVPSDNVAIGRNHVFITQLDPLSCICHGLDFLGQIDG